MDKTDQLIIRACKLQQSKAFTRLNSVYRRFYLPDDDKTQHIKYIANILIGICDKYNLITIEKVLYELNPEHIRFMGNSSPTYTARVIAVLIETIRYTKIEKLKGLTPPYRFKKLK